MAGYACDSEEGEAAQFLCTNLETGDTASLCAQHLPGWCQALLEGLGASVTWPGSESPENGAAAAGEGVAAQQPPRPKRGQRRRQGGEAELQAPSSPFPDATPVDG